MKPHNLRFKWDPKATKVSADTSKEKNQGEPRRLEDYFDFIEQFKYPMDENKPGKHVDKKFSLFS